MAIARKLRAYFFAPTSVTRADGTIGGIRFLSTDKPTQATLQYLVNSAAFLSETEDRARVTTGGALENEQGLVVLATDAQAKANATQLSDRSLAVQPHQLPTVVNSTDNSDTISNSILNFTGDALLIAPDTTATRNKFVGKLSTPFKSWLGSALNTVSSNFIPLTGTIPFSPVTGDISFDNAVKLKAYGVAGLNSMGSFSPLGTAYNAGNFNNVLKSVDAGDPTIYTENSSNSNYEYRIAKYGTSYTLETLHFDSSRVKLFNGTTTRDFAFTAAGLVIGTSGVQHATINADLVTSADTIHQLQNKTGVIAHLDDIVASVYNAVSPDTHSFTYTATKNFNVTLTNLSWKPGNRVRATLVADPTMFIEGEVISYIGPALLMKPDVVKGVGTVGGWTIAPGSGATLDTGTTTFSAITFGGGATATIGAQSITYSRGNGRINISFSIEYTSTAGFPVGTLVVTLPSVVEFANQTWYGNAVIGNFVAGTGTPTFPFRIYTSSFASQTLTIADGDFGSVIPSGHNIIYGNMSYASK